VDHTPRHAEHTDPLSNQDEVTKEAISRAIGNELCRVREALGLSRLRFVEPLPSGIGERTLLSYEHGKRHMSLLRLLELCHALGVSAPTLLTHALQRARIELANLELQVDLRALINDGNHTFRPMVQWARNKLNKHTNGVVGIAPSSIEELADFMGHTYHDLAKYLTRFTPDTVSTRDADTAVTMPVRSIGDVEPYPCTP
jgi:transcriptional regulator with XRE-family HTH domain